MFYAHSENTSGKKEPLEEHLRKTATLAEIFANAFGEGNAGRLMGWYHDLGKASELFQGVLKHSEHNVHSNGFSLVRKVFTVNEQTLARHFSDLGATLGDCLLTPTKIYVKAVMSLLDAVNVKSISHITGGGFYENIPRSLPNGISAKISRNDVQILPIFDLIEKTGHIPERDMFNTFNMGVGLAVVVDKNDADKAVAAIKAAGEDAYVMGELVDSDEGVIIC